MADGIYPGPKGLRERLLSAWRSSAEPPVPRAEAPRPVITWGAPALELRPPGITRYGPRLMEPIGEIDRKPAAVPARSSYFDELQARVRGEITQGPSVLARHFENER